MRHLTLFIVLAVLLTGCTDDRPDKSDSRDVKNAMLGIVGRHPCDPEAQTAAIEESDYFDSGLDTAAGQLIRDGVIISTDKGLKVVPREEWPEGEVTAPKTPEAVR